MEFPEHLLQQPLKFLILQKENIVSDNHKNIYDNAVFIVWSVSTKQDKVVIFCLQIHFTL